MIYDISTIRADVRKIMDETADPSGFLAVGDMASKELDSLIEASIESAARAIESSAPIHLLDYCESLDDSTKWSLEWITDDDALLHLPTDFMRMICLHLPFFQVPLYDFIPVDSPKYAMQKSRFAVKGTIERPVAALVRRGGKPVLEVYAHGANKAEVPTDTNIGDYLPMPRIEDGKIELCELCYKAIIYRCAGMVLVSYNDSKAENLLKISEAILV